MQLHIELGLAAVEVSDGQILPLDHPLYQRYQEWLKLGQLHISRNRFNSSS